MMWWSLVALAEEPAQPVAVPAEVPVTEEAPVTEETPDPPETEPPETDATEELEPPAPVHRGPAIVDRVAASVNEDVVLLSEIYEIGADFVPQRCPSMEDACVREAEIEVLDALIERSLIQQELVKLGMAITASDVDQAIDRTVQQYQLPDRQALRDEVERSGKRWDDYRDEMEEYIREQTFKGRVLAPRVS
ncbi:MAG: SurA N-terminal domain-containing protein, partial [Myxococcales bacterium]|nr:SurA N-terminal domain-containing protein [Myxococcales bacterium]